MNEDEHRYVVVVEKYTLDGANTFTLMKHKRRKIGVWITDLVNASSHRPLCECFNLNPSLLPRYLVDQLPVLKKELSSRSRFEIILDCFDPLPK